MESGWSGVHGPNGGRQSPQLHYRREIGSGATMLRLSHLSLPVSHGQIRAGQSWPRLAYRREPQLPCGACGVNPTHCGNCIVYCVCNLAAQAPPEQISSPKYPGPHSAGGYGPSGKRQRHFPQSAPISNGVGCPGDFTLFTGLLLMVLACQEPKEQGEVCKILTNYFDVKLFI